MMENIQEAVRFCEDAILRQRESCIEKEIYPSWSDTADHIIARRNELAAAYVDIFSATEGNTNAVDVLVDALMCTICAWSPRDLVDARDARRQLSDVNIQISDTAAELSALLEERENLQNTQPIASGTHYHILKVIKDAAEHNPHYAGWVDERLSALSSQFDMKYWPALSEVISAIATDAYLAKTYVSDPITAAALASNRASKSDFCRALLKRVNEAVQDTARPGFTKIGHLPHAFHLKDETWASLVNILLDLAEEEMVDGSYIKRLRQRSKELQNAD